MNEKPLSGWTVYLDSNRNGRYDRGERTSITDSQGNYSFAFSLLLREESNNSIIAPIDPIDPNPWGFGTHKVALKPQLGWKQTSFPTTHTVTVEPGKTYINRNFGVDNIIIPRNLLPVANNDSFELNEDTTFKGNVLINDFDPDRDPLTAKKLIDPANGTLTFNRNGTFSYTPNANYHGKDRFTYIVSDGRGGTDRATVVLTIKPVNDAPIVKNLIPNQKTTQQSPFSFTFPSNTFYDVDGDALKYSIRGLPQGLSFNANTRTISGAVTQAGSFDITVTAKDTSNATASDTFNLSVKSNGSVVESDFQALVALYKSTKGDNWYNNTGWKTLKNENVGSWYGVTVVGDRVVRIDLSAKDRVGVWGNNLIGTLPSELGNLSNLQYLNLSHNKNKLSGEIPSELGKLSNLKELDLHWNELSGEIPFELGNLSNLQKLDLDGNQLSGTIPSDLGKLSNLQDLDLDDNQLSGTIPSDLGKLSNLQFLDLNFNKLSGTIPSDLGKLSNLRKLSLYHNRLSGEIPSELGKLSTLQDLLLDHNRLSGKIPSQLRTLSNLRSLWLFENELDGAIPSELGELSNLKQLLLHSNKLDQEIPSDLGTIESLQKLWLNDNLLIGEIPDTISNRSFESLNLENPPYVASEIPDQEIKSTETLNLDISSHFADLNSDRISYRADKLPRGLTLNSKTGVITGQPTTPGTYNITITGTDNDGSISDTFEIEVIKPPGSVIDSDFQALVALYKSTNGENWSQQTGWRTLKNENVGNWDGVTVEGDRVVSINLSDLNTRGGNNLIGTLPSELGNLSNLRSLYLRSNRLTGNIPSTLGKLSHLRNLDLNWNNLTGEIPSTLGKLSNLRHLNLSFNKLSGEIPSELGNLSNLQNLWFVDNELSGEIPSELGKLSNLLNLWLGSNNLSGKIPSELGKLSSLVKLSLVHNQLGGEIPSELGELSKLQELSLFGNELSGEIPSELVKLSNLQELYLSSNSLSGEIPSELGTIKALQHLWLGNNRLEGTIPESITNRSWIRIDLENPPYVASEIPDQEIKSTDTLNLDISGHFADLNSDRITYKADNLPDGLTLDATTGVITGQVTTTGTYSITITGTDDDGSISDTFEIEVIKPAGSVIDSDFQALLALYKSTNGDNWDNNTGWKTLTNENVGDWYGVTVQGDRVVSINLDGKNLVGTLPSELGNLSNLRTLWLPDNELSGKIPSELGNLSNLRTLWLRDNELSGEIPSELGNLSNLRELDLFDNELSGEIPSELVKLSNLRSLHLNDNKLSGEIPSELVKLSNLRSLHLNDNKLSGEIPSELGNLSNLQRLALGGNELSGEIPSELGNLSNLQQLDLYHNELSGEIPSELGNLFNLRSLWLQSNELSGEIPSELGNLSNLKIFYLYDNELSGEIPSELGNLSNLLILSLFNNELSGEIPSELGNLSNLLYLWLYDNELSGEIPSELGEIISLKSLLLQNNRLDGIIPKSITNRSWEELNLENPPYVASEIPDQEIKSTETLNLDISSHFGDLNSDRITYKADNLPDGLTLDATTGVITGQVTTTGSYSITVTGTDNDGSISDTFEIEVIKPTSDTSEISISNYPLDPNDYNRVTGDNLNLGEADTSFNRDIKHTTEVVNYLVIEGDKGLQGTPYDPLTGNRVIMGTEGDDSLFGLPENDTRMGQGGSDIFVLEHNQGMDTIADFELGVDKIGLTDSLTFGSLTLSDLGEDTSVMFNNQQLALIKGVQSTDLTSDHFVEVTI